MTYEDAGLVEFVLPVAGLTKFDVSWRLDYLPAVWQFEQRVKRPLDWFSSNLASNFDNLTVLPFNG